MTSSSRVFSVVLLLVYVVLLCSAALVGGKPNCNAIHNRNHGTHEYIPISVAPVPINSTAKAQAIVDDNCRGDNEYFNRIGNFDQIWCNTLNNEYTITLDGILIADDYNSVKTDANRIRAKIDAWNRECRYQGYDPESNTVFFQTVTNVTLNMAVLNAFQFYMIVNESFTFSAHDGTRLSTISNTVSTNMPFSNFGQIVSAAKQAANTAQGYLIGIPFFDVLSEWISAHPRFVLIMVLCTLLVLLIGCCVAICVALAKCCRRCYSGQKYLKVTAEFEDRSFIGGGTSASVSTSTATATDY